MSLLSSLLTALPEPDLEARNAVAARASSVLRPTGALARVDEVAAWLAAWQRTERPAVDAPRAVVVAADHGVAAVTGVSAYPTEVTVAMLDALEKGAATAAAMTNALGMPLDVGGGGGGAAVGVGRGVVGAAGRPPCRAGDGRHAVRRCRASGRRCGRARR